MKYLFIYWIWINCTISITIEKFDSCDFTKKSKQNFHSNEHKCVGKKTFCWKIKDGNNYVGGLWIKIHFIYLSKW